MTQFRIDGVSMLDQVMKDKRSAAKNARFGSTYWKQLGLVYPGARGPAPEGLQDVGTDMPLSEPLIEAILIAKAPSCTWRSQKGLIAWLQTTSSMHQREFVGVAKHVMTQRPMVNEVRLSRVSSRESRTLAILPSWFATRRAFLLIAVAVFSQGLGPLPLRRTRCRWEA